MPPRAFVRWLVGGNNKVMLQELFLRFASFAEIKLSNTCEFEIIGSAFERFHLFSAPLNTPRTIVYSDVDYLS